jgi:hypothetical protein
MQRLFAALALFVATNLVGTAPAFGQQAQLDLHGNYVRTTQTWTTAWGAGGALQVTWGGQHDPINVGTALGVDRTKQENGGPTQTSGTFDLTVQPGGNSPLVPYVGASSSANWSGGAGAQWTGARHGLEMIAGLQFKPGGSVSLNAQERYGYVEGQEHTLTTRLGVLISP